MLGKKLFLAKVKQQAFWKMTFRKFSVLLRAELNWYAVGEDIAFLLENEKHMGNKIVRVFAWNWKLLKVEVFNVGGLSREAESVVSIWLAVRSAKRYFLLMKLYS